jgi:peptide/nickel transport system ATP-binding protein
MDPLLELKNLVIQYHTDDGVVEAVNGVDLCLYPGEALGLVGETGAGKTTAALGVIGLIDSPPGKIAEGQIFFEGRDLRTLTEAQYRAVRGKEISMIFQDPMTALNPVFTVLDQVAEVIENHQKLGREASRKRAAEMLELVRIPAGRGAEDPHQFSGGMKQRVVIAMALACNPKLLIADEPTTALDVTIQAQVLELMKDLKRQFNTSMLLITHDLGVVSEICDRVAILYAGEIVESGSLADIFENPLHPYTNGLFGSIPSLEKDTDFLSPIEGLMPDPAALPAGCKFHPRCRYAGALCGQERPVFAEAAPGHGVRCFVYQGRLPAKEVVKYA